MSFSSRNAGFRRLTPRTTALLLLVQAVVSVLVVFAALKFSGAAVVGTTQQDERGDRTSPRSDSALPAVSSTTRVLAASPRNARSSNDEDAPRLLARHGAVLESERDYYTSFLAQARQDSGSLDLQADTILRADGPRAEKVALLRALYDVRSADAARLFSLAITELPDESGPNGESVPSFAERYLGQRAARDPRARAILEDVAWGAQSTRLTSALRMRAAAHLAQFAREPELERIARHLAGERDPVVAQATLSALAKNPDQEAVRSRIGSPPVPPFEPLREED